MNPQLDAASANGGYKTSYATTKACWTFYDISMLCILKTCHAVAAPLGLINDSQTAYLTTPTSPFAQYLIISSSFLAGLCEIWDCRA